MNIYTHVESPVGRLLLRSDGVALTGLYMDVPGQPGPGQPAPDKSEAALVGTLPVPVLPRRLSSAVATWTEDAAGGPLPQTIRQLEEYFAGKRREFELPLRLDGTAFQRRVWQVLMEIPYGATWSYGQLAKRIDNPNASRAVGLANGQNPISILVPCHRVIGADGSLTGYGGGVERKRWLLAHEGLH